MNDNGHKTAEPVARVDLKEFDLDDLRVFVKPLGKESYRAVQLMKWLYQKDVADFDEMSNLARTFREELRQIAFISRLTPNEILVSRDGTRKFLFRLADGAEIETVLIPEEGRTTLCLSTQVGCPLGCTFCVTGMGGFKRNLRVSEIVGQVQAVARTLEPEERISNIVVMGMGEPLLNFDNLLKSLRICLNEEGLGFSHRRVAVSTAGVVPNIEKLATALPVNLAVSLNATTEELRREIMPISRKYPLKMLLEACRRYPLQPRKKITFEYVLLAGVNDSLEDAARLHKLLKGIPAMVNLIPYNGNAWSGFETPTEERVKVFQNYLVQRHLLGAVRWSRGPDIGAACGQLGRSRVRGEGS